MTVPHSAGGYDREESIDACKDMGVVSAERAEGSGKLLSTVQIICKGHYTHSHSSYTIVNIIIIIQPFVAVLFGSSTVIFGS